jgi:hypothetical protein
MARDLRLVAARVPTVPRSWRTRRRHKADDGWKIWSLGRERIQVRPVIARSSLYRFKTNTAVSDLVFIRSAHLTMPGNRR